MKQEREERVKLTSAAAVTIVTILLCCALYFLGGSGYGKETAVIEDVEAPATAAYVGAFEEGLEGLPYSKEGTGHYVLCHHALPALTVRLELDGYMLKAMTLTTQMPVQPEKPAANATILENRLYAKRKEYFEAQRAWLVETLPVLIRAMDPSGRLTEADAYDLAYYALTVEAGERQEKTINGFCLRAYGDAAATPPSLCVSVQDNAELIGPE